MYFSLNASLFVKCAVREMRCPLNALFVKCVVPVYSAERSQGPSPSSGPGPPFNGTYGTLGTEPEGGLNGETKGPLAATDRSVCHY